MKTWKDIEEALLNPVQKIGGKKHNLAKNTGFWKEYLTEADRVPEEYAKAPAVVMVKPVKKEYVPTPLPDWMMLDRQSYNALITSLRQRYPYDFGLTVRMAMREGLSLRAEWEAWQLSEIVK